MKPIECSSKKFAVSLGSLPRLSIGWCVLLLAACAQQVSPRGGDKDEDGPIILSSEPLNESLNYQENTILLEFDEFVRSDKLLKELIVTPPLKKNPEVKMRGKKVEITWTDTLLENATYLFQFGDGIVDVNEGNVLDSNVFVFATGAYLDSFELKGKVVDAFTQKPVENVWVMLYAENIDSMPYNELPRYFSRTDKTGAFHIQYLAQGDYKIFALEPGNNGYYFDLPDERIGYVDQLQTARLATDTTVKKGTELRLFTELDTLQYLLEFTQNGNKGITLAFNNPVDSIELKELSGKEITNWVPIWSELNDTVTYWFQEPDDYDSLKLEVIVPEYQDTVFFRKPNSRTRTTRGKKSKEIIDLSASSKGTQPYYKAFRLESKTPLSSVQFDEALLIEGKDSFRLADYATDELLKIRIDYPWKQGTKYVLFIPDSAICDRYGLCNDTLKYTLTASKKDDYGSLKVKYDLPDRGHPYVWQLMKGEKVFQEDIVSATGSITYDLLPAASYRIRVIHDENANGRWDPGLYILHQQPEWVSVYSEEISIRSNWVSEVEWTLKPQRSKRN